MKKRERALAFEFDLYERVEVLELATWLEEKVRGLDKATIQARGGALELRGVVYEDVPPPPPPTELDRFQLLTTQKKWWKNSAGDMVLRKEMNLSYRSNLINYLERNAELYLRQQRSAVLSLMIGAPDDVFGFLEKEHNELHEALRSPLTWLQKQPLYQALVKDRRRHRGEDE